MLSNGDLFPALTIDAVGGGTIQLPRDLQGAYGVVLIYRGSWCPYCNAQLSGFARLQSTGFVLDRSGKVITAVYSSGAIGRLVAEDVAGFVRYVRSHS